MRVRKATPIHGGVGQHRYHLLVIISNLPPHMTAGKPIIFTGPIDPVSNYRHGNAGLASPSTSNGRLSVSRIIKDARS